MRFKRMRGGGGSLQNNSYLNTPAGYYPKYSCLSINVMLGHSMLIKWSYMQIIWKLYSLILIKILKMRKEFREKSILECNYKIL